MKDLRLRKLTALEFTKLENPGMQWLDSCGIVILNPVFIFSAFHFWECILMSWKKEYTLEYSEYGEYYIPHFRVNSHFVFAGQ